MSFVDVDGTLSEFKYTILVYLFFAWNPQPLFIYAHNILYLDTWNRTLSKLLFVTGIKPEKLHLKCKQTDYF